MEDTGAGLDLDRELDLCMRPPRDARLSDSIIDRRFDVGLWSFGSEKVSIMETLFSSTFLRPLRFFSSSLSPAAPFVFPCWADPAVRCSHRWNNTASRVRNNVVHSRQNCVKHRFENTSRVLPPEEERQGVAAPQRTALFCLPPLFPTAHHLFGIFEIC